MAEFQSPGYTSCLIQATLAVLFKATPAVLFKATPLTTCTICHYGHCQIFWWSSRNFVYRI